MTKNTTHLAGEFLVAGELSRRGYPVSITMGNAKSVDIYAESSRGVIKVDAKAGRAKGNWPMAADAVRKDVCYVFVHLRTDKQIKENIPSEYFIVWGREILTRQLVKRWGTREGIRYTTLNSNVYKEQWHKLPPP
jgi:hypothetical protein